MPRLPKFIADIVEVIYKDQIYDVEVIAVSDISDKLRQVSLKGDFKKINFTPGGVVEFRVNNTDYRHYTLSYFNQDENSCAIIFYLHGKGSGSQWANELKVGDKLKMIGVGDKMKYNAQYKQHFVFGDETSIGLAKCMYKESKEKGQSFSALIELDKTNKKWEEHFPMFTILESYFDKPAHQSIEYLKDAQIDIAQTCFYLTGRAKSIQQMKRFLKEIGVNKKQMQLYPYWAEGKKGL